MSSKERDRRARVAEEYEHMRENLRWGTNLSRGQTWSFIYIYELRAVTSNLQLDTAEKGVKEKENMK